MSYSLSDGHAPITGISIPSDVLMPSGSSLLVTFVSLVRLIRQNVKLVVLFKQSSGEAKCWWNTSHQRLREDLDDEHTGDMALYSKGEHGGGPPSWHTRVQEGLRWTTRWECVQRTTVHIAKNTHSHKQFHFIYCLQSCKEHSWWWCLSFFCNHRFALIMMQQEIQACK